MGVHPATGMVSDAYDDTMAGSFLASLEYELIDRRRCEREAEARTALFTRIEGWYRFQ